MKKYIVYRTEKGTLTFKETDQQAYTISASTDSGADKALRMLKTAEKQLKKEEDNV